MKKFRTILATFVVAISLGLTACGGGGGGGGGETPTATPTPTPSPTPPTGSFTSVAGCTVPVGATFCQSTASWTTANAVVPRVTAGGATVSTLASGTATFSVNVGDTALALADGSTTLATSSVTAACADGTANQAGTCVSTTLKYTDKVYAIFTNNYIYEVGGDGQKDAAINQSSFRTGAIPLGNCTMPRADQKLPDGHVLRQCTAAADLKRHTFKHNPVTNVLTDFDGTIPAGTVFTSAEADSTQPVAGTTSCRISNGWYYADPANRSRLLFQADAGGPPVVKYNGTFVGDGTIGALRCVSNK